jgi:hypothetical protein
MPKVMFVNEHRQVEVAAGKLVSEVARALGIKLCRAQFPGVPIGDWTVWIEGDAGCVSPPRWFERVVKRCEGRRRMANRTRILGDCQVVTQQGLGCVPATTSTLAPLPTPTTDPDAARFDHERSPAGTAWNPYGHPRAVGQGKREAPRFEAADKKKPAKKEAGAAAAAAADGDDAAAKKAALREAAAAKKTAKAAAARPPLPEGDPEARPADEVAPARPAPPDDDPRAKTKDATSARRTARTAAKSTAADVEPAEANAPQAPEGQGSGETDAGG